MSALTPTPKPLDLDAIEKKWEASMQEDSLSARVLLASQFIPALIDAARALPTPEAPAAACLGCGRSGFAMAQRCPHTDCGSKDVYPSAAEALAAAHTVIERLEVGVHGEAPAPDLRPAFDAGYDAGYRRKGPEGAWEAFVEQADRMQVKSGPEAPTPTGEPTCQHDHAGPVHNAEGGKNWAVCRIVCPCGRIGKGWSYYMDDATGKANAEIEAWESWRSSVAKAPQGAPSPAPAGDLVSQERKFAADNIICPKCCSAIPKWKIGWPIASPGTVQAPAAPAGWTKENPPQRIRALVRYIPISGTKELTTVAEFVPHKTVLSEDFLSEDCDPGDCDWYDEEKDCYWVNEGWWESSFEADTNWRLNGVILAWMLLPKYPNLNPETSASESAERERAEPSNPSKFSSSSAPALAALREAVGRAFSAGIEFALAKPERDEAWAAERKAAIVAALVRSPSPSQEGTVPAKIVFDYANFWTEKGDKEGTAKWRQGLQYFRARAEGVMKGLPIVRAMPAAPSQGAQEWTYFLTSIPPHGKASPVCSYCHRHRSEHRHDLRCPIPNCTLQGPPQGAQADAGGEA